MYSNDVFSSVQLYAAKIRCELDPKALQAIRGDKQTHIINWNVSRWLNSQSVEEKWLGWDYSSGWWDGLNVGNFQNVEMP